MKWLKASLPGRRKRRGSKHAIDDIIRSGDADPATRIMVLLQKPAIVKTEADPKAEVQKGGAKRG